MKTREKQPLGELLDVDGLAAYCGVTRATVYAWNHTGQGPRRSRIGKRVVYRLADVDRWLDERVVDPEPAA